MKNILCRRLKGEEKNTSHERKDNMIRGTKKKKRKKIKKDKQRIQEKKSREKVKIKGIKKHM